MTNQEIFNTVVAGLASQGFERSLCSASELTCFSCALRGEGGKKCAVGWLIPDEKYFPGMENETFPETLVDGGNLVRNLIWAHDDGITPAVMRANLRTTAAEFNFTLPESLL